MKFLAACTAVVAACSATGAVGENLRAESRETFSLQPVFVVAHDGSNKCLHKYTASAILQHCMDVDDEKFYQDGERLINVRDPTTCLKYSTGSQKIVVNTCGTGSVYNFYFDSSNRIRNRATSSCFTKSGTELVAATCGTGAHQRAKLAPIGAIVSSSGKCIKRDIDLVAGGSPECAKLFMNPKGQIRDLNQPKYCLAQTQSLFLTGYRWEFCSSSNTKQRFTWAGDHIENVYYNNWCMTESQIITPTACSSSTAQDWAMAQELFTV